MNLIGAEDPEIVGKWSEGTSARSVAPKALEV